MNLINNLQEFFSGKNSKEDDSNILRNMVLVGLLGILFVFISNIFSEPEVPERKIETRIESRQKPGNDYNAQLIKGLEETISSIKGVGKVKVQLLFSRGASYKYEYNQDRVNKITNETDQNGGKRKITEDSIKRELVIIRDANGDEKPVIRVMKKPKISGVIVVAGGAEISETKYEIFKTIKSYLDLPAYKINVLPHQRR